MPGATKRLSTASMQEKLDNLASDVSMPIPDMGLARLLSSIFTVLGLGFILLGGVALFFAFQAQPGETNPGGATTAIGEMGQMIGSARAALVLAGLLGIMGGASYMLIGATVSMIADIRVETAHNHRLLAAILESNLRSYNPNQKLAPQPQPQPYPIIIEVPTPTTPTTDETPLSQDTDPVPKPLVPNP